MNATQHTPGPWTAERGQTTIMVNAGIAWIASVKREADAKLIAAAPELLAACQLMVEWMEQHHAVYTFSQREKRVRAAIAKATA